MKESFADTALSGIMKRVELASDRIASQFKTVKPFDMKQATDKEKLQQFDNMDIPSHEEFVNLYGEEAYYKMLNDMEALRRKYNA